MRIALCQLNPVAGDIAGNVLRIRKTLESLRGTQVDLLVFPELFIQGYPPRDLLEHRWFVERGTAAVEELRALTRQWPETAILTGAALPNPAPFGKPLTNSAILISNGEVVFRQDKSLLPTYDVFDEHRYFEPARKTGLCEFGGLRLGITICEDAWNSPQMWPGARYATDPVRVLASQGAQLLVNLSGSPFHLGKQRLRYSLMQGHATAHGIPFLFLNQVGGQDELIFDGASLYFHGDGRPGALLASFEESVVILDTSSTDTAVPPGELDTIGSVHDALVLGVRDYVRKCGFCSALLGLSGGIDSSVTAAIAVAALGPKNVLGVTMPSRYSSPGSIGDSETLARNLGIAFREVPIEQPFAVLLDALRPLFGERPPDLTEENLQARVRGTILMSLSNKLGHLLLTTGNKSEMAVGYCTLYGDMNGGLSVIADLPKTMVYRLAAYINRTTEFIPRNSIVKPPSAELRPGQTDQDSLPPYEVLDGILHLLIEEGACTEEIAARGYDPATVAWVIRAVMKSEYKRRQAPPGLKVTPKAFGSGRRFPIAARYEC